MKGWFRKNRISLAIPFIIALLIGGGIDLFQATHSETAPLRCVSIEERERIRTVVIDGIDQALKTHVIKLFDVWMKDTSNQPQRAIEGMEAGISAHVRARTNALNWNPPAC